MRKLFAGFAVSLDGYIEGPNGEYDWIIFDKEQEKELAKQWKETDAMFYGRKTYEMAMKNKSEVQSNPFTHMKHYVFSNTLSEVKDGFILLKGDTKENVEQIKNMKGKNIAVFGGAELACALIELGLVDELVLAICPVLIGSGKPFFSHIKQRHYYNLKNSKTFKSGVVWLTYETKR